MNPSHSGHRSDKRRQTAGPTRSTRGHVSEGRDLDDMTAPQLARIQRLYDTALARSAVRSDRSLQRYVAVLMNAPQSA